jgi:putative Holliday junction resolvase
MSGGPRILLGFDFGSKRIGVAVGQVVTRTATALETLESRHHRPDWNGVSRLVKEWQPEALVVGLPLTLEGAEQELTVAARRFGRQLQGRYGLTVHFADERLSTYIATRRLGEQRRDQRQWVDREAARLILQTWLNQSP